MVNNPEGDKEADVDEEVEVTVDEDEGELEVVQPSEEWQTLKPGNVLKCTVVLQQRQSVFLFSTLTCVSVCVCVSRAGSAPGLPCEVESADRSQRGQTGRGAAQVLDTETQVWVQNNLTLNKLFSLFFNNVAFPSALTAKLSM